MKKILISFLLLTITTFVNAFDFSNGLYLNGDVSLNSNYIWRGQTLASTCAQPSVKFGYNKEHKNFTHDINIAYWGAYGRETATPLSFYGESDVNLSYDMSYKTFSIGASLGYYYYTVGEPGEIGKSSNLNLGGYVIPFNEYPFTIYFETVLSGADDAEGLYVHPTDGSSKVYSTYIELSYPFNFNYDINLTIRCGFTPHYSLYTDYNGRGGVNNIQIDCEKIWSLDKFNLRFFGTIAANPYRLGHRPSGYPVFQYGIHTNIGVAISL